MNTIANVCIEEGLSKTHIYRGMCLLCALGKSFLAKLMFGKPVLGKLVLGKSFLKKLMFGKPVFGKLVVGKLVWGKSLLEKLISGKLVFEKA